MPQTGVHSLIATAVAEKVIPSNSRSKLAWGILLGSVLPDIDILPMAIVYLITGKTSVIYLLHRSGTHSLSAIILVFLVCFLLSKIKGKPDIAYLGYGLGLGILLHIVADMLWWGPVDFFWPLGFFGLSSEIYLLKNHPLTPIAAKLLGAGEFLAYALYFWYLKCLANKKQTNIDFLPKLKAIFNLQLVSLIIFVVLAFLMTKAHFEILLYVFLIMVFFPLYVYVIFKMKSTIEVTLGSK